MLLQSEPAMLATPVFKDRLTFTLPDFTRISWVSDSAREMWAPRIRSIVDTWREIEWLSVEDAVRPCCVAMLNAHELVARGGEMARHGLAVLPLELTGLSNQTYSTTSVPYDPTQPAAFRCVIGRQSDTLSFLNAWGAADQDRIGDLLGYPECCRVFFHRIWVEQGLVDTTWPMAVQTAHTASGDQALEVRGAWQANILWRWMGVRAAPHLPCRLDCSMTVDLADALLEVARRHGYQREMSWLEEILEWPLEWTALHGIAEVKTPILKVSARTDSTATKYRVRYRGAGYPTHGALGVDFPYQQPGERPLITQSRGFLNGLAHALPMLNDHEPVGEIERNHAADNGFASVQTMDVAHQPIVDLARDVLRADGGAVLDLGCGNAALLKKIVEACPQAVPAGVEQDERRAARARLVLPQLADTLTAGSCFDVNAAWRTRHYKLALVMPGRLLEVSAAEASGLRSWLREHCERILVYAYGDWLERFGDLNRLALAAGFQLKNPESTATAAMATIGDKLEKQDD